MYIYIWVIMDSSVLYSISNIYSSIVKTTNKHVIYKAGALVFKEGIITRAYKIKKDIINNNLNLSIYIPRYIRSKKDRLIYNCRHSDKIIHTIYNNILLVWFNKYLIVDSYSCLKHRGIFRAVLALRKYQTICLNYKDSCLVKIDLSRFFYSINRDILSNILVKYFKNSKDYFILIGLLQIINSYTNNKIGLPLGNCLSQLLTNVYLNQLDQYCKRVLHIKYYIRYADDIFILLKDNSNVNTIIDRIDSYLNTNLNLSINYGKSGIRDINKIDCLGYIVNNGKIFVSKYNKRSLYKLVGKRDIHRLRSWYSINRISNCYSFINSVIKDTIIGFNNNTFILDYRYNKININNPILKLRNRLLKEYNYIQGKEVSYIKSRILLYYYYITNNKDVSIEKVLIVLYKVLVIRFKHINTNNNLLVNSSLLLLRRMLINREYSMFIDKVEYIISNLEYIIKFIPIGYNTDIIPIKYIKKRLIDKNKITILNGKDISRLIRRIDKDKLRNKLRLES